MGVRLTSNSGVLIDQTQSTAQTDKRALLVYAGLFDSMDGPVEITPAHLETICRNHNLRIEALGSMANMADFPPIQLDHSTSARDTVGRLVGAVELGMHNGVPALFGQVRILGAENWERVLDGRWTHLSIGADLDKGEIQELTITPFPAAKNACLLKRGEAMNRVIVHLMKSENIDEDEAKARFAKMTDEEKDEAEKKLSANDPDEDGDEDKKKKEELKRLQDEEDEKAKKLKEEEDEKLKKLKDDEEEKNKTSLSAAMKSYQEKAGSVRLKMRTANLQTRFARLRAQAKVSPAELKKVDFVKLAAANDATLEAVLQTYEAREPVIMAGQYGSLKATNASKIAHETRLSALEIETRANMSSVRKKGVKLSEGEHPIMPANSAIEDDSPGLHDEDMWGKIVEAIRAGKDDEGRVLFSKACRTSSADMPVDETAMANLMSEFAALDDSFSNIVRLVGVQSNVTKV